MRDISPKITDILHGKTIETVWKCENLLVIRCTDGIEVNVAWVDPNGEPINGEPAVRFAGLRVFAKVGSLTGKGR